MQKKRSPELLRQHESVKVKIQFGSAALLEAPIPRFSPQEREQQALSIDTGDGLWDWNLQTNTVYFSSRWKAMLGYQDTEIGDSPIEWLHRVHPEDVEKVRAEITAHFAGRTPHFENEHRLLHKDGTYRWIRSQGRVVRDGDVKLYHMVGFQTDLTQYRQAIESLRESEEQFRAIAEALPLPAIVTRRLDGLILYVNQSYANAGSNSLFDLTAEQLIGRNAAEFFHNLADRQALQEALAKDGCVRHYELPVKRTDGTLIWLDLSLQPLTDKDENLLLVCFFDITKRKQIEAELHKLLGQLSIAQTYTSQDKPEKSVTGTSRPSLTSVFRFIETNYRNPIGLREVAASVGYSPAYLTNLVQHETGKTINQWIAEYRMAEARLLLLKTDRSVNQIAPTVGYQGTEHFIRQFRQLHGMTPKAWREEHRSKCG